MKFAACLMPNGSSPRWTRSTAKWKPTTRLAKQPTTFAEPAADRDAEAPSEHRPLPPVGSGNGISSYPRRCCHPNPDTYREFQ